MANTGQWDTLLEALAQGDLVRARGCAEALRKQPDAGQLAAEVLHELRQPLLGVKAYAQLMREEDPKGPVGSLIAQVERMEQIISDYTRLASNRPAPKEKVDLVHHVKEAVRQFVPQRESSRAAIELDVSGEVLVEGNGRLLEQLVINLLGNARDAMAGLGRIKVAVGRDGGAPTLYVADWGPGISPELRERIFEPYVTSKSRGSGLGLAVCRRIAEEHKAELSLAPPSSLPDKPPPATVFRLRFPPEAGAAPTRKRILVVDDEAIIRMVFRDLLSKEADVTDAASAEDALAHLSRSAFDLIITDKNLPGLSGLELAQEARRLNPSSRVILMTGYPSLVTAQQAIDLGVMDYLLKPFDDIREVREKIRAALTTAPRTVQPSASRRVDVYEDNPASAGLIREALDRLGLSAKVMLTAESGGDEPPAGVVVSWDFTAARAESALELARRMSRGAPFVVLAEHLTMESTLASLRAGASACLPKLLADSKAMSRELSRALKVGDA